MINHDQAARIAASITMLRPDWPQSQIVTLCGELKHWPLLDLAVGLAYIAIDRKPDGSWASKSPYRVKEQGPWRAIGIVDPEQQAARDRGQRELQERHDLIATRARAIRLCPICDDEGRLANSRLCTHDDRATQTRSTGAAAARQALADARAARQQTQTQETADA